MAAEAEEKIFTGGNAGVQVEALHTASAALALAVLINGHHDDGAAGLFHQPGCHDANDTGVPVPAPDQDDPVLQNGGLGLQLGLRGLGDLALGLLPGGVDLVQFMCQLGSAFLILTQHQLQGGHSAVHPARRVDAGGNGIADILGGHGLAAQPHLIQQGQKAGPVRVLQQVQARFDQGAVLAGQGHHVRHGAHGGKVAAVIQHLLGRAAVQRGTELEGHTCAAQALEGAGIIGAAGVHHGNGFGQGIMGQMVIGDDQVHPQ